ncbi:beta-1,3-glucanase [Tenacibaculum adriaticum]|uniref:Beta-1,3-glucanase n=1 Tax=Tenacibaculum adriaticum TaxID=413713 RepID=A0A5S5DUG9_9FLAO|nr:beta-1,3-glucanase family protein [Tenacibaculum adriaticum]TYP99445.1 beta-1,3-glucanase [Tenacibaculum adriaticum]
MSILNVKFKNKSTLPNSNVFIGFVSGSSTSLFNISSLAGEDIKQLNTTKGNGNWYSLDELNNSVQIQNFSGRIYVSYGKTWKILNNYYEPAQNITDPNFFLRYDKMELTFNGKADDVADLTSIDYWSIPMQLETFLNGASVQTDNGLKTNITTKMVYNELNSLTSTPQSGLENALPALVPGNFTQSHNQPGTGFARIIGPSSYPSIGGVPVTPYNLFKGYLNFLIQKLGPNTVVGESIPNLGNGTIATIAGHFNGVGPHVPLSGSKSAQTYNLTSTIDNSGDITLTGTVSSVSGTTTMLYKKSDLINPNGIYGANAPFSLNGAVSQNPANDVYGWITGDLLAGLNIGAIGSETMIGEKIVGAMKSSDWFTISNTSLFSNLQSNSANYNQYAATLQKLSDAYNFAYSDRFSPVLISLNPTTVNTLQISLLDANVLDA